MREENVKTQLRLKVEQDGIPTTWREYLRDIKDDMDLDVTMKTLENWTKELRDELEDRSMSADDVELDVEAAAQHLARDAEFVFKYVPKADKRKYAKTVLQDEHGLSEQEAESIVDEVVQEAVAELRYEDLINTNYYPKIDGETRDEQKQRFHQIMGTPDDETGSNGRSAADTPGVSEEDEGGRPEPPGSAWTCDCGAENAPDRAVCRRCTTAYADVDSGE